jgi:predicted transcriptional regulator with HTH domain
MNLDPRQVLPKSILQLDQSELKMKVLFLLYNLKQLTCDLQEFYVKFEVLIL